MQPIELTPTNLFAGWCLGRFPQFVFVAASRLRHASCFRRRSSVQDGGHGAPDQWGNVRCLRRGVVPPWPGRVSVHMSQGSYQSAGSVAQTESFKAAASVFFMHHASKCLAQRIWPAVPLVPSENGALNHDSIVRTHRCVFVIIVIQRM